MTAAQARNPPEARRFRARLLAVMMLVIAVIVGAAIYLARRGMAASHERGLEREFQAALATMDHVRELRHAALMERCRALARRPRIHAALEDGALDLLYPSARDELRDAVASYGATASREENDALGARFYRFLDGSGRVLGPPEGEEACGVLSPDEEMQLALAGPTDRPQIGCIGASNTGDSIVEIIAMPIVSTETGLPIAALVLGFEPVRLAAGGARTAGFVSGVWYGDHLDLPELPSSARAEVLGKLQAHAAATVTREPDGRLSASVSSAPHLLFYKQLNPGSSFPPAYEVCLFPLADLYTRQRRVAWQILGAGGAVLFAGFLASHHLSGRFSKPVAALAHESAEQRIHRERAEIALETTSAELERVARFSADASHQLKTPVTVLRAGLEEMLARGAIPDEEAEEVSALIHQTYRLSTVIEDLLLLSRMDAGQLKISFVSVDLGHLVEASLDDLSATPDDLELAVESEVPSPLLVAGDRRFIALILQNLLENARKYNRPRGRIRVDAHEEGGLVVLKVGNTTRRPIPRETQAHVFERFHRGGMGEDIPGYGIGLNLSRELARLHDGDLRLVRSDDELTEFELRLRSRNPETTQLT